MGPPSAEAPSYFSDRPTRTVTGGPDGRDPLAAHKRIASGACAHWGGILGRSEKYDGASALGGPTSAYLGSDF